MAERVRFSTFTVRVRVAGASMSASVPPFWSPMCMVNSDSSAGGTAAGTPIGCGPCDRETHAATVAVSSSRMPR